MPKKALELGPLQVSRLAKPGAHAVGGVAGLQLKINDVGARSWVLRAMVGAKRRDMGLGGYPDVTLAQARLKAREAREQIDAGLDPIQSRQRARSVAAAENAKAKTFEQCVETFMASKSAEWRNAKHRDQWQSTLNNYASKKFGKVIVGEIALPHVLSVLEPIWATKTVTASRLRGRIETILDWAAARGYRQGDNPARWRGHLDQLLAKPRKISTVRHHPAVDVNQMSRFMSQLTQVPGNSARALQFLIFTAGRSGEVRGARWAEIDSKTKVWTVPAARMKNRKEHRVPLSTQAMRLLDDLPRGASEALVFPGANGAPLSDMSLTACMRRMNVAAVPHGFRSTFRDWASELTQYARELPEMALSHTIESAVEAAYRRGDLLDKRSPMMQDWANFCTETSCSLDEGTPFRPKS